MANVKLALVVVFIATFVMFPMKKIEGCGATWCTSWKTAVCDTSVGRDCGCAAWGLVGGNCIPLPQIKNAVREHYNLCESHNDYIKKGSGSIYAYYPNSELQHGWCFTSNVEAERYFEVLSNPAVQNFFNTVITSSNEKEFLKMALDTAI